MKKILIITAIVIVIVGVAVIFSFGFGKSSTTGTATPLNPPPSLPVAGSTGEVVTRPGQSSSSPSTIIILAQNNTQMIVNDFVHNGETVLDKQNPDQYFLAGSLGYCLADGSCPHGAATPDFNVTFDSKAQFFTIALQREPLGAVRSEAEQFLMNRLGISAQQMCTLQYYVGTTYLVNQQYDNKNLGFSFCPGATALPK